VISLPCRGWLAAAAASLVLIGGSACSNDVGQANGLPDVALVPVAPSGAARSAADITGPAVVNLWATWCGPCRKELPAFQAVAEQLQGSVDIIGVNQGDDAEAAAAYLEEIGVTFPQYLDADGDLTAELRITGLPATVFIAADGTIDVHSGAVDEAELLDLVDEQFGITPSP
jgi:cytochrome c biogenesis protein CcmG/thiol:disulfide interchange protein DsbE